MGKALRVATRRSELAVAQAQMAARALEDRHPGLAVELVEVVSEGDRVSGGISEAGGKDLFVGALRKAVAAGEADCACHSLKDVGLDTGAFVLAAMLPRADPRDALVGLGLRELAGMDSPSVATSSPRRAGQLSCEMPNARAEAIRGNVGTRLAMLDGGAADALLLACAGLDRLGLGGRIAERLDPDRFVPAPCQGTVALECLGDDAQTRSLLLAADDAKARLAAEAERNCAREVGADCDAPLGALAAVADDGKITATCSLAHRGMKAVGVASGHDAEETGRIAAQRMLDSGGDGIDWSAPY